MRWPTNADLRAAATGDQVPTEKRKTVGDIGSSRYVTVDTHPADAVRTLNQMAGRGYAYKAVWTNLEDLVSGWQRFLFEKEDW